MSDGLEGVIATETILSDVDGSAGRLVIRGHPIERLAGRVSYERVAQLLFEGLLPVAAVDFSRALGAARVDVFATLPEFDGRLQALTPVEQLRALLARLPDGDDSEIALNLLAAPAVFTAAALRVRAGRAPVAPDPGIGHAADLLRMVHGAPVPDMLAQALDTYLVTTAEHGLNASTFAARIAASTRAGLASAVIAGLSALKGPLHGGAPGPIIEMLDAIGRPENAPVWLEAAVARGDRLMGFGHRLYRVRDPRADALKAAVRRLCDASSALPGRLAFAEAVEKAALDLLKRRKPDRPLETNVEFYTALLLEALDLPADAFICIFATARTAGWLAHAREQILKGRLIRPASRYVGPPVDQAA